MSMSSLPVLIYERSAKKRKHTAAEEHVACTKRQTTEPEVRCFPTVDSFLEKAGVRCRRIRLDQTFKHLVLNRRREAGSNRGKERTASDECSPTRAPTAAGEDSCHDLTQSSTREAGDRFAREAATPWDDYLEQNRLVEGCQLVQTFLCKVSDEHVFVCVPYPRRVDVVAVAGLCGKEANEGRLCSLKEVQRQTGFPTFVCLPFGTPAKPTGKAASVFADRALAELPTETDLVFDCGTVALRMKPTDFLAAVQPTLGSVSAQT
eukprot:TRINITY_DN63407_c0_g1_i1.p1 TRINITY_DN63407_c0_g1~~TRINITY_DN63407_c0_g1_i1.p1  ORF type:complete len:263 (-),score=29.98 TRINITY_DN63407_c0_g1_i1:140-928(-)